MSSGTPSESPEAQKTAKLSVFGPPSSSPSSSTAQISPQQFPASSCSTSAVPLATGPSLEPEDMEDTPIAETEATCSKYVVDTCGTEYSCPKGEGAGCDPCSSFVTPQQEYLSAAATAAATAKTATPTDAPCEASTPLLLSVQVSSTPDSSTHSMDEQQPAVSCDGGAGDARASAANGEGGGLKPTAHSQNPRASSTTSKAGPPTTREEDLSTGDHPVPRGEEDGDVPSSSVATAVLLESSPGAGVPGATYADTAGVVANVVEVPAAVPAAVVIDYTAMTQAEKQAVRKQRRERQRKAKLAQSNKVRVGCGYSASSYST